MEVYRDDCDCDCCKQRRRAEREINELGYKAEAAILLLDHTRRIQVPSSNVWIGIGLLERDGELKR